MGAKEDKLLPKVLLWIADFWLIGIHLSYYVPRPLICWILSRIWQDEMDGSFLGPWRIGTVSGKAPHVIAIFNTLHHSLPTTLPTHLPIGKTVIVVFCQWPTYVR